MNRHLMIVATAALMAAAPAAAASNFDGTWKGDVQASQLSKKPSIYLLGGGTYSCSTCVPKLSLPADGAFHPVGGSPYYDAVSITVTNASTVKRATRKGSKLTAESTVTISPDGKTATFKYTDLSAPNGVPITGTRIEERVAAGPAGAHALSGSWRVAKTGEMSDSGLIFTLKLAGDTLSYSTPIGTTYTAKVGGPAAPVTGDAGWTGVTVKRTGPNTLLETDLRDGKPIGTYTMTVSADGKKMTTVADDLLRGRQSTYVAYKQ